MRSESHCACAIQSDAREIKLANDKGGYGNFRLGRVACPRPIGSP